MKVAEWVFWLCLFLAVYSYFLYPAILFLASAFKQAAGDWKYAVTRRDRRAATPLAAEELPPISLIFPAYNEEAYLPDKIANVLQLGYPKDRMEVIIVSDGSVDRTNEILGEMREANIRVILLPERKGKFNALNHAAGVAKHNIFVFCDATTLFAPGAIETLVRHFRDPRVGVVAGALEFRGSAEFRQTEGVYWKYESVLRLMEARLGLTFNASGAIYALRRGCYRKLTANDIIEDCLIPMHARALGYRILYDPEAVGYEIAAPTVQGEFGRKARYAVGGFRALVMLTKAALRSSAGTAWAFISHKLLRWITPFLLLGLLVSNACLVARAFYACWFGAQVLFYLWAGAGFVFHEHMRKVRFALFGYFVVAMSVAMAVGFFRFLTGREETLWQRAG